MQTVHVTANFIFSQACTMAHLQELALSNFVGLTQVAVDKLAAQQLKQTSGGTGRKGSAGVGDLPYAKLRTVIVNKLQNNPDINEVFATPSGMEFEFAHMPDPMDMGTAGQNKSKRQSGPRATSAVGAMVGAYVVVKQGVKCTPETDPGKHAIWQHVWACDSFEQYFATAPAKGVTKTGRVITARSEMQWAVKSGWVKPVAAEQAAQ